MKCLSLVALLTFSFPAHSVEFHQCIDSNGNSHFTNLPGNSLDRNCAQKTSLYTFMLDEDYRNLSSKHKKYEFVSEEYNAQTPVNKITQKIDDLIEPDKALDALLENTERKPDNTATKFFNARSDAVEQALELEIPNPPITD